MRRAVCSKDNTDDVLNSIEEIEERSYRRGFSHGFVAGSGFPDNEEILKEVTEWANKSQVIPAIGAPGTICANTILGRGRNYQRKKRKS